MGFFFIFMIFGAFCFLNLKVYSFLQIWKMFSSFLFNSFSTTPLLELCVWCVCVFICVLDYVPQVTNTLYFCITYVLLKSSYCNTFKNIDFFFSVVSILFYNPSIFFFLDIVSYKSKSLIWIFLMLFFSLIMFILGIYYILRIALVISFSANSICFDICRSFSNDQYISWFWVPLPASLYVWHILFDSKHCNLHVEVLNFVLFI